MEDKLPPDMEVANVGRFVPLEERR